MIAYVREKNPDERIFKRAKDHILAGEIVCFPSDTNWVAAASPFLKKGVDSLYRLKNEDHKHYSLLCCNISQASEFAIISNTAFRMIKRVLPGPYTFIFRPTGKLPKPLIEHKGIGQKNKQIGIRIPQALLALKFVEYLGVPLLTTSLHYQELDLPSEEDLLSYQIELFYGNEVAMILDPSEFELGGDSTVIDFSEDDVSPHLVRLGAGKDLLC